LSFQKWAAKTALPGLEGGTGIDPDWSTSAQKEVILWPDTFNNYFHPETARAAVDVLRHAGFKVLVPRQQLCCGRPLYHCGMKDEESLLRKAGADLQSLDSGCCGMAGSFGFEKDNYNVSLALGERVLLPAVRQAAPETLIVSDGFSCREQILQTTGRKALHLA